MYIPVTEEERRQMLARIGASSIDELFQAIPPELRRSEPMDLPPALCELELTQHLSELADRNVSTDEAVSFLGGGCYDHFIPAVVDSIAARSEYYTSYTPYQAEVSQGTLQTAFEFQTLINNLTGLDVSNASLYEAATSLVEAYHLAAAATGREGRVVVSETVHPEYRQTLATYLANLPIEIVTLRAPNGVTDMDAVERELNEQTSALMIQSPNFFGVVEPVAEMVERARQVGALTVQSFDPALAGLMPRPGDLGVDIAIAEGQGLGSPMAFGGPFLGLFACRSEQMRRMPGRIVGETTDRHGNRCFVLTLQTREQHIRREKATSNICSNQALLALRATVYLSLMGPHGMRELAELCWHKAHHAAQLLGELPGVAVRFPGTFVKEFVLELPGDAEQFVAPMLERGFHAGVPLGKWYPDLRNCLLVAVTEKRTRSEIERYVEAWRAVLSSAS